MKIEEYLETLPENLLSGEDVQLPKKSFREIFKFADVGKRDVFYHLGCGNEIGIEIAINEFKVKKAVGIDNNPKKIQHAKEILEQKNIQGQLICNNIEESDISDASVILFWFTDDNLINKMLKKFENLKPGTKIITIWGPLIDCLPEKVNFPYIINKVPFKKAQNMQEQVLAIFGVKCVDFVTAWEFAERYTKSIGAPEVSNDRFLTIIQTLVIWINAKKLGVACGEEIPESIQTYINIMKMYFDIDFEYLLKE
ncbi:SAM-dependent methyltransferase [Marine Group I thaumarchaeote]|uniref:SAM-dependent methyltransferase n=1 Tax=Marine Group I thaumarchaeote TaxID=2511932 RepID=A0A7K4P328_9ARCH|nr:MAG: SAM-dependent methyltransferase [Nitrosopumilus sp. YT1]NMI81806.1 SAM-dependent methyltransferase [Candidatus Nitrosopumilus sp. MTA1]NWJ19744.1 SAM-dependent methyltransferase [Marine Group I thaumarchaeote]NWJ28140.1 SAM-dependent methyltransferase [Marine Group I thaumarchaeote]NWJ56687.1 SAM-dependent methyltransferase [Marine Group I thaumarchaeote]